MSKNYSKYDDCELFIAMKSSDKQESEAAFAELYSRYSQRIYAYCLRVTGDAEDAQDIFQETFLKFFDSAKGYNKLDNVPGFILIIARNVCLNYKRDKKLNYNIDDFNFGTTNHNYEQKELLDILATALELLDDKSREVFVLRQYQGLSYKEISEITGQSISSIKNRVWRTKDKLKNILSPYLKDLSK